LDLGFATLPEKREKFILLYMATGPAVTKKSSEQCCGRICLW